MTPTELKEARAKLGLSTAGLAKVLRLGAQGGRTVRRWESGENAIPGPAQVAIEMLLEAQVALEMMVAAQAGTRV